MKKRADHLTAEEAESFFQREAAAWEWPPEGILSKDKLSQMHVRVRDSVAQLLAAHARSKEQEQRRRMEDEGRAGLSHEGRERRHEIDLEEKKDDKLLSAFRDFRQKGLLDDVNERFPPFSEVLRERLRVWLHFGAVGQALVVSGRPELGCAAFARGGLASHG